MGALAKAYVELVPKMKGFKELVNKEADSAGKSGGEKYNGGFLQGVGAVAIGNALGNALTAAAQKGASAVTSIFSGAFSNYAEYEQLTGGVETLFKESAEIVQGYAEKAYQTAGLSANSYMDTVTSFSASLLQSLDGDTRTAAEKAHLAITDMSDNANKMGSTMESIQNAYQGFAKANYTMLDNLKLGYGGTKSEMERLLADAEKISGIKFDISSYSDIVDAIHVVQTEMGITGTTAKEAATTIEGSVNSMKAAWQNWLTDIGRSDADLGKSTEALIDSVIAAARNAIPRMGQIIGNLFTAMKSSLPGAVSELFGSVASMLRTAMANIFSETPEMLSGILGSLTAAKNLIVEQLPQVVDGIAQALPSLAGNLITGATALMNAFTGSFPAIMQTLIGQVPRLWQMVSDALIVYLPVLINGIVQAVENIAAQLPALIGSVLAALPQIVSTITQTLTTCVPQLVQGFIQLFGAFIQALPSIIEAIVAALPQIVIAIVDFLIQAVPMLLGAAVTLFMALVQAVPQILVSLLGALGSLLQSGFETVAQGAAGMLIAAGQMMMGVISGIGNAIGDIVGKLGEVKNNITNFFASAGTWLLESGRSIIQGLINGITGMIDVAKGAISSVVGAIRNFLPFSPAKEGPFSGRGWTLYSGMAITSALADGILNEKRKAVEAMDSVMGGISGSATARITASAAFGASAFSATGGGVGGFSQTININQPCKSPAEMAREMRMQSTYGLAGAR